MEAISVNDYRNNMASSFARADRGERVLIRRKNHLYALTKVDNEIPVELQRKIDEARKEFQDGKTRHFANASEMLEWMDSL